MIITSTFALLAQSATHRLESLDLTKWTQGWGRAAIGKSLDQSPLKVAGKTYEQGLASHAPGGGRFLVEGRAEKIEGEVAMADTGHGTVSFSIWGDGRQLWQSKVITKGQAPEPFSVPLKGIKVVSLVMSDAQDGSAGDHSVWLNVRFTTQGAKPQSLAYMKTLAIQPSRQFQTIDNFGASDSWTVEPLIKWPEAKRREVAELLFSREKGAGLSAWRHNFGGGINHETITMALRTVDSYDAGEGKFDFTRCPGKRWMLKAAKDYGVEQFIGYAVTPPRRLTRNGFTNGTDGQGTTNLREGAEPEFARYLAGIIEHYVKEGYPFKYLSPINEPDFEWNGVPTPSSQEGSRASVPDIKKQNLAISRELKARGLKVQILSPEATSPQIGFTKSEGMTKKYGAPYGAYVTEFAADHAWREEVSPIYAYHSYWSDGLNNMVSLRKRLREELDKVKSMRVWQTEYCQLSGPRNEGGHGRDLGMTMALNLARLIHLDLTIVNASAWQWWLGVSDSDYKDGLVYVDDLDKPTGDVFASKSLFALGQFARFVRPGFQRIGIEGAFDSIYGVMPSAYRDPKTGRIVLVLINNETSSHEIELALPAGKWTQSAWITSERPGHNIAPHQAPPQGQPMVVPSLSVMTLVFDPVK